MNKWICIKDFPEDLFFVKEDVWKVGKVFTRFNHKLLMLNHMENFNLKEYLITFAEWRDKQIDKILEDE